MRLLLRPWRHYADFNGRSSRTECLVFFVTCYVILLALVLVVLAMDGVGPRDRSGLYVPMIVAVTAAYAAMVVPAVAVLVRRLHDQGRSGLFVLLNLVPFVGPVIGLVFAWLPGDKFENDWGPDPRKPAAEPVAEIFS